MILKIRDADGNVKEILAIKGEDYVLTDADKQEIANLVMAGSVGLISEPAESVDLSNYYTKSQVDALIPDVSGFVTEGQVQTMINKAIAKMQGGEEAVIISFSIEDYQFQAEEGMTWREWVNSEYNTDGACVYNNETDTVRFVEYSLDVLHSNSPVKGADTIISGYFYYLS